MTPEISLQYVHGERIGYGRLGVNLHATLTAKGVDVYDGQRIPDLGVRIGTSARADAMDTTKRIKDTNVICWVSSPTHAYHGWLADQHAVIFTMYETNWLPESYRKMLHDFDQVIVPSEQNVELFGRYHDNVAKVPLGVDPTVWHYQPRPAIGSYFYFLLGGSGPRKGGDLAQQAFAKAFPTDPTDGPLPRLILKSPRSNDNIADPQRVSMIGGYLSPQEEVDLYASAHCYLQPSRGEGFGLQPLQAIAQGLPTILTDAHGHADFAHLGYGISAGLTKSPAGGFLHGDHPDMMWWEPNLDELVDQMRYVYEHYHRAEQVARASAKAVAEHWTWANVADRFIAAIGPQRLAQPYSGDGEWFTPSELLYPVTVKASSTHDIGGKVYQFEPGVEYWEPADVKRVLFDADKLHPSCFDRVGEDGDTGLLPRQVAKMDGKRAAFGYCRDCGQRLNTIPRREDDILAEMEAELAT